MIFDKCDSNEPCATNHLIEEEIGFELKNNGRHLVVECCDYKIDFWPSTGKFIPRENDFGNHYGVRKLVEYVRNREKIRDYYASRKIKEESG